MTITFIPDPKKGDGIPVALQPLTGTGVPAFLAPGHVYQNTNTGDVYIALPIGLPLESDAGMFVSAAPQAVEIRDSVTGEVKTIVLTDGQLSTI